MSAPGWSERDEGRVERQLARPAVSTRGAFNSARGTVRDWADTALRRGTELVGGPARARVVLVLAGVLALQGADIATVSATASELKQVFQIDNTGIGLLVSVTAAAGAVGTIPVGVLTDRTRRTRLVAASIGGWALATVVAGAAQSFIWLLLARVLLGIVTATSGPTIASLTGDFFPARSRARMLGYILAGELIGVGIGYVVSGEVAALIGWRWAFWWLVLPSAALLWQMWRLPEPARDGQTRLRPGQVDIPDKRQVERDGAGERAEEVEEAEEEAEGERASHSVGEEVQREHVPPRRELVLTEDPTDRSLWWALRYVLAVPTNRVLIIASALGYFYFQGLKSFALIFVTQHYRIPQSLASLLTVLIGAGALAGVWLGGRAADRLLGREVVNARVIVPTIALVGVVVTLAPAAAMTSIGAALPLLILAAGSLGAVNPPLDAARLDIMHPALWGRAESVRTWLRSAGEAIAPLLFGWVSETVFGGRNGLEYTLLLFLITLVAAAGLALRAWRTYGRDVATAAESHRREPS